MELTEILARLDGARRGASGYVARCPAHPDRNPSLSIDADAEGRILLHCHAGCEIHAVVAAIGIKVSDLFLKTSGDDPAIIKSIGLPIDTYEYRDESNALLYEVLRYQPKTFRQRRPDGNGGWQWNLRGTRRVVYRLPELKGRRTVLIPEGEKDVNLLWSIGLPATTNSGGAGKWTNEHSEQLVAAGVERVVIVPDNDAVGANHAEQVVQSCTARGLAAKVVKLPGVGDHGDVSDFLNGKTKDDFIALLGARRDEQPDAPVLSPTSPLVLTRLSDVPAEEIEWIWPTRIAKGKYTLIAGNPGEGKSRVTFDITARVTTGAEWPDGGVAPLGNVLMLLAEDGLADTVRPAIEAMGGDCSRVHVIEGIKERGHTRPANLADDLAALEEAIVLTTPVIVVIDPITAYLGGTDSYKDADMRGLLAPVQALIAQHGVALLAVAHLNKDQQKSALYRVGGSIAISAASRCAFALGKHPDDPDRRVIAQLKSNISGGAQSLAFRLPGGRVIWDATPVEITAEDLFSRRTAGRSAVDDAEDFLKETLAGGPIESDLLMERAKASGHSKATIRRAKSNLGLAVDRVGFGANGKWFTGRPYERLSTYGAGAENASIGGDEQPAIGAHVSAFEQSVDSHGNHDQGVKDDQLELIVSDRDDGEWEP